MDDQDARRVPLDEGSYLEHVRARCFICETARRHPDDPHHLVYEDEEFIAFLDRWPMLLGQTLVAPREHRERVTGDFSEDEYLKLQRIVWRVGEAIRQALPTERLYIASMGSEQANRHVHWHVAALAPGTPYDRQQWAAFVDERGVLDLDDQEMQELASRISHHLQD